MILTDERFTQCIGMILSGDKNGLREIYDEYGRLIYKQLQSIVKSPQDAEDLTSDFFLKLWENAAQYRSGTGHKRYINVMARNLAIDFLRKRKHESYTLDDETFRPEQSDEGDAAEKMLGDITYEQALDSLSNEEKEIINLKLGFDMTFQSISETLGRPLGTVTWKYRQAIEKLRKTVKEGSIYG